MDEQQSQKSYTGKGEGPQGIDKAPGEETAQGNTNFTQDTQKGKKVDADLQDEKDKPEDQSNLEKES